MNGIELKELLDTVSEKVTKQVVRRFAESIKDAISFYKTELHAFGEDYIGIEFNDTADIALQEFGVDVQQ